MWSELATVWGVSVGIGIGIDMLFIRRVHKASLHRSLIKIWHALQKTTVPELAAPIARSITLRFPPIFRHSRYEAQEYTSGWISWSTLLASIGLSVLLTIFALSLAFFVNEIVFSLNELAGLFWKDLVVLFAFFPPNILFDVLTVAITLHILTIVAISRPLKAVLALAIDAVIAGLLAITVAIVADKFVSQVLGDTYEFEGIYENLDNLRRGFLWIVSPDHEEAARHLFLNVAYASTTLLPTVVVLLVVISAVVAKPIAELGRVVAIHILGASTDFREQPDKFPVAAMTGTLIAFVLSIVVVSMEGFRLIHTAQVGSY